jgi:hypothetical protein
VSVFALVCITFVPRGEAKETMKVDPCSVETTGFRRELPLSRG